MYGINMDSILAKAGATVSAPKSKTKKRVQDGMDAAIKRYLAGGVRFSTSNKDITPDEIAEKFIDVLTSEILASDIGGAVYQSFSGFADDGIKLEYGAPQRVGKGSMMYRIPIYFTGNLSRRSLAYSPSYRRTIDNIMALLNNGYDISDDKPRVHGYWHGEYIANKLHRPAAGFIDAAVTRFVAEYGDKYGVVSIDVDDIYK